MAYNLFINMSKNKVNLLNVITLDMYMVTSREEGGPMGLLESMACGVPVVSTPVGMAPDLLQNNLINGLALNCSSEEILKETQKRRHDLNKYQLANRKIQTRKQFNI